LLTLAAPSLPLFVFPDIVLNVAVVFGAMYLFASVRVLLGVG
jgi:hypothetical protein